MFLILRSSEVYCVLRTSLLLTLFLFVWFSARWIVTASSTCRASRPWRTPRTSYKRWTRATSYQRALSGLCLVDHTRATWSLGFDTNTPTMCTALWRPVLLCSPKSTFQVIKDRILSCIYVRIWAWDPSSQTQLYLHVYRVIKKCWTQKQNYI